MNYLHRLELWGESHHSKWLDIIRVALGIFLCYKAISFLSNMSGLIGLLGSTNMATSSFALVLIGQMVVVFHLLGGFFILIGLHTRIACLSQIPILVGAIIAMGKSLKLRVVAEGIETRHQLAYLRSRQCTEGQGYYFGRPIEAAEFATLLATSPCH